VHACVAASILQPAEREETKIKRSEANGTAIKVLDKETNVPTNYTSIKKAAEALGASQPALSYRFQKTNSFILKGRYLVEKATDA
jgi:ribosome-binding protein aMBF1 (putative translation factor)